MYRLLFSELPQENKPIHVGATMLLFAMLVLHASH
jgi:hypothetical protein